jgi:hypothetical protein
MPIPTPTIYVRNRFAIKTGQEAVFWTDKAIFVQHTLKHWELVAAFGQWPLVEDPLTGHPTASVVPSAQMVHLWRVHEWDTLYETMYQLSEASWYRSLGDTLEYEDHDFLVSTTAHAVTHGPSWGDSEMPDYLYVYDESLPSPGMTHNYLREVNWFSAQMRAHNWEQVWITCQITSQPAVICVLWRVPCCVSNIQSALREIAERVTGPEDHPTGERRRYRRMMGMLQSTQRHIVYPIYTEKLNQCERERHPSTTSQPTPAAGA